MPGLLSLQGAALLQSSSLPRAAHIWNPLHIWKTPATILLQVSIASRDLCLCNCPRVVRGLPLLSPIPRASLTLSPCRVTPASVQAQLDISPAHL